MQTCVDGLDTFKLGVKPQASGGSQVSTNRQSHRAKDRTGVGSPQAMRIRKYAPHLRDERLYFLSPELEK